MEDLKPCPFCGSKAFLNEQEDWPDCAKRPTMYYGVGCKTDDCYCEIGYDLCIETKEMAIQQWDTRIIKQFDCKPLHDLFQDKDDLCPYCSQPWNENF